MSSENFKVYFACVDCPNLKRNGLWKWECTFDPEKPAEVKTDVFSDVPDFCPRLPF